MILDARNESVDLNRAGQVCIVGAGPAGITLARELAGVASVLLVESGGFETDEALQALQVGDVAGIDYPLTETRARQFGGSSGIWAGYCAVFDRLDFARREWVPDSGWPFGGEELQPFYEKTANLLNLGAFGFDAIDIMARAGIEFPFECDDVVPTVWRFGTPTLDFGKRFREEFELSSDITTLTHANVVDIRLHAEHSEIEEIVIRTLDGREGRIDADIFVLACGGIETPRILLNANTQVHRGLGNRSDMVGRCFMEHPHVSIDSLELCGTDSFRGWVERDSFGDGRQFLSCIGVSPEIQEQEAILNARGHMYRTPQMSDDEVPRVGVFLEQAPNPESRVILTEETDALGLRRICLDWRLTQLDWRTFEQTALVLGRAFERINAGRMHSGVRQFSRDTSSVLHSNHHLGTTRMSTSSADGVVNADCRMHDYDNLYIAGGGVFPTVSWANPTFTLIALIYRLAENLKATLVPGSRNR